MIEHRRNLASSCGTAREDQSAATAVFIVFLAITITSAPARELKAYDEVAPNYTIHTDLGDDSAREAGLRASHLLEMYRQTTSLAVGEHRPFPLYLFSSSEDYFAADGPAGTAGAFVYGGGNPRLLIAAELKPTLRTWHLLQHEGFHQYARAASGRKLPSWLDEGLAEYFGEAIFTGDGYVTGATPAWRLRRLSDAMSRGEFEPLPEFFKLTGEQWNSRPSVARYDQAWSIVHLLVNDNDASKEDKLPSYIRALAGGREAERAFVETFGPMEKIQARWQAFWTSPNPPRDTAPARAVTATITSFLARATAAGQTFDSFEAFRSTVTSGVRIRGEEKLPAVLLREALEIGERMERIELVVRDGQANVRLTDNDQTTWIGSFTLRDGCVDKVNVTPAAAVGRPHRAPHPNSK